MEMENSLRQLDEYLKNLGKTKSSFEEHDDERNVQEKPEEVVDITLQGKSSETFTNAEKSSKIEDNELSSSMLNNVCEKSTFTRDFTPNKHNSIDSSTEICDSGDTVLGNGQTQTNEDNYFGTEASVFKVSDNIVRSSFIENVKSESIHFVESEEAANELAEIGLSEESLQEFALSGTQSSVAEKPANSDSATSVVHPVSLKKSTRVSEESAALKPPKGQVTTLMDLSSIGELKRLWTKSTAKKHGTQSTKKLDNGKSSFRTKSFEKLKRKDQTSFDEKEVKQSTHGTDKTVFQLTAAFEPKLGFERKSCKEKATNRSTSHTKQCSVKLVRLEGLLLPENLKIDITIPKRPTMSVNGSHTKTSSGTCKQKIVSKKYDKFKGNVKTVVANSLKRISAKSKTSKIGLNTKVDKQILLAPKTEARNSQKNYTVVTETALKLKTETSKIENVQGVPDDSISFGELDISNEDPTDDKDNDDDYVPSDDFNDDDYNPKKKTKKTKAKRVHSVKHETVEYKQEDLNLNYSIRSSRKKMKGPRIGRPPVYGHFECKFCDFTANEKNLVDKHHYKFHRMVLTCEHCKKKFRSVNGLLEHQAYKHDGGKPFKCEHEGCNYASKNPTDLDRHKAKHDTELRHVCDICGWRTKWRRNMRHHHTLKHCDERNYKCTICEFAAKRPYDLKEHMYRHTDEKPIQCLVCGFRVKTNYELRSHMLVHSKEKPFKCTFPGCSGATKTRADLTKHMRVHQTERPFKCHICSKCYKDQHALNKHISGIHVAERKYKCDICGKSFKNRYALTKHMSLHAGHKPHECPVCQWKFSTRSNMEKHMVTHDTNERPYPCPLCPHAAKQPDHLLAHIGTVHGDKYAYFCELCKKPFKRYMQLKMHYERMHTEKEIKKLKSPSDVDLALLKMEMKLEFEEKEAGKRRKRKSRSKSKTSSDVDIKEEPIDAEYGDVNVEEDDINDVRLDEDTGNIVILKKKSKAGKQADQSDNHNIETAAKLDLTEVDKIGKNEIGKRDAVKPSKTLNKNKDKSEVYHVAEGNTLEHVENEITVSDSDGDDDIQAVDENEANYVNEEQKYDSEDTEKKKDSVLIAKDNVSTVALYENFRLPLATKGFKFNYNKNGTKPMKAWFMDVSLMDRQTAEKHRKHRRRLGLLPPIPRGHPPKGYKRLKCFVDKRKKQLAVNIKKAKFVKDLGLVSKRHLTRSKRFQGKYTEFETVTGEALSMIQVQERLPKLENLKEEKSVPVKGTSRKMHAAKKACKPSTNTKKSKVKSVCSKKQNTLKSKVKSVGSGKQNTRKLKTKSVGSGKQKKVTKTKATARKETTKKSSNKKKLVAKTSSTKSSKLLLSTEKRKPGRPKLENLKIRKPAFLETRSEKRSDNISVADTSNRNSFEALESILSEFNQSSSATLESENKLMDETGVKLGAKNKANSKKLSVSDKKQKSKLSKKSNKKKQAKPKYNEKYVPVKQPVKRKSNRNENNSNPKKLKPAEVVTSTSENNDSCIGELVSNEQNIQPHLLYPTNVHIPVHNSQLVMVYPASVFQADNLSETNEIGCESIYVAVNGNCSYVSEEAAHTEKLELKRDLNDMLTDSLTGSRENASEHNTSGNSDRELMQKEYTETVVVKAEPCADVTYYTSLAQQSTGV